MKIPALVKELQCPDGEDIFSIDHCCGKWSHSRIGAQNSFEDALEKLVRENYKCKSGNCGERMDASCILDWEIPQPVPKGRGRVPGIARRMYKSCFKGRITVWCECTNSSDFDDDDD